MTMSEIDDGCKSCPIYQDGFMEERMCGHCDLWNGIGQTDEGS